MQRTLALTALILATTGCATLQTRDRTVAVENDPGVAARRFILSMHTAPGFEEAHRSLAQNSELVLRIQVPHGASLDVIEMTFLPTSSGTAVEIAREHLDPLGRKTSCEDGEALVQTVVDLLEGTVSKSAGMGTMAISSSASY